MKKLMNCQTLHLEKFNGYLGNVVTEGSYCEQKIFISKYDEINSNLFELLNNTENNIKNEKTKVKRLSKFGNSYHE